MVGYLSGLLSVSHVSMARSKRLLPIPSGAGNSSKQSGSEELGPGGYNIKVMQNVFKLVLFQKSQFYIYCKFQMSFINDKIEQFQRFFFLQVSVYKLWLFFNCKLISILGSLNNYDWCNVACKIKKKQLRNKLYIDLNQYKLSLSSSLYNCAL